MNSEKIKEKKYNMFRRKPQNSKYINQGNIILANGGGSAAILYLKRDILSKTFLRYYS